MQRDTLAFSSHYWSSQVFLSVRPSLLDQDMDHNALSKYKQFQDQNQMFIFNQQSFSSPWYNGDNLIGGGIAGTLLYCYCARTNVGSDVALADVSHLWSRLAELLTNLGRICCWVFVIHCGKK